MMHVHFPLNSSIIRMVATSKDDRRRVEKALEAANLPSGKVRMVAAPRLILIHLNIVV